MNITLEIGKYNEQIESAGFQKMEFSDIDEAIANLEFMKMGFNYFKTGESLVVRLDERQKSHLIDYDAVIPIQEIRKELEDKYHPKLTRNEKEIESITAEGKTKISANSNFTFEEDETTRYAKTSSGEKLPFKLFNPNETGAGSNLLREPQDSLQSDDFALVERRFAENKSIQLFGNEKIGSIDDVAWLFKALEDEAVEHAFLVYDFKDKGYFVQHISTGTFDAAFVDNRLLIGNVLEANPSAITLVHNHPSGNLKVSKADVDCIIKLKMALEDSDIKVNSGVIINLRSGKYVVFDENETAHIYMKSNPESFKEIQPYSFSKQVLVENYQPVKITSSTDIAKFITSQKFGISDKTELLVLNNQLNIVGKFIMPPDNQLDFIIGKVARFGGSKCILYGNNITPEQVNTYNKKLHFSGIEILDAIRFNSGNGRKLYESFADSGELKSPKEMNSEVREYSNIINYKQNQKSKIMETQKEFNQEDYLRNQMKYLGFGEGEKLHKDLETGLNSAEQQFEIKTSSDKASAGNEVDFTLKFNKTESGGVFLNSYKAVLNNDKSEEISQNFPVNRENTFTAKEAINLLEGRAVKIEFTNPKTEQLEPAFVKLNFAEPKTEKGNYNFQNFYKNYGVDTNQIVEKSNLIFDKPEYRESTIKSLEKGNVVKVKFEIDDQVVEGKAVLNPQYKNLSIYDQDMNRINTNKPLEGLDNDNKHDKSNVKEQSIKR
ncbi:MULTISPECIES: JAB domain-containing protein [unclassified Kaistella]|uniref:JAB domain-containing protein n=1 Tax=unclassified Kaistella TaxID=2762626 RepID=UPI002734071C|nr:MULTISPECIES: JAB domain-containing protein [unclassified Kaistella]MDP2455217.1 JAB domain-containing protein [Kaistella sp. SH11-4b]MDP2458064.1 JAB domain-containing protein [Kaistella sp. SH40-3]MDP2461031.1 JAB domain-containing protein [Kaistella sp. SH19-2b]